MPVGRWAVHQNVRRAFAGWSCSGQQAASPAGRPRKWPRRQLLDGNRWRTRTRYPWRDVPESYGPWERVSSGTRWSAASTA
ncbi:transposase [Streptomyces sp. NPDC057908]|uniref:transposase n=1 Tax=Streptomyces sp. NPDC057908 TaxID=3346276 RepID=UPI0036E624A6